MMEEISLGECPCGEPATWYRDAPPVPTAGRTKSATGGSVRSIGLDDIEENLCDGCFKGFTGSLDEAVPGWKHVDVLRRQTFAGEESQTRQFDDYSQVSAVEEW